MDKRKLYLDFDNTIVNATKKIVELYDKDFWKYENYTPTHWTNINTYSFDELTLINKSIVLDYFDDHRFFMNLEYMENAKEVLDELKDYYEINICSIGRKMNLYNKKQWIEKNLSYAKFIGIDLKYGNKSSVDMSGNGSVILDDNIDMLYSSNADIKVIYGDFSWSENNIYNYPRCFNWYEFKEFLKTLE